MRRHPVKLGLVVFLLLGLQVTMVLAETERPAIVLTAFGTSTAAFETYQYLDQKVRERFPGHDLRWAYTSRKVRQKVKEEQQRELPDLAQVLQELQQQGYRRAVVQSLHIVPGEEWQKKVVATARKTGLKVALGQPLLVKPEDHKRVLAAVAKDFPADLQREGVILVGHGSPVPSGEKEYLNFHRLLRQTYANKPVYFGVIEGKPEVKKAVAALKKTPVMRVTLIPFLLVAGDHYENDIMGDKDSLKAELQSDKPREVTGIPKGLGYNDGVVAVFLDHLSAALRQLEKQ